MQTPDGLCLTEQDFGIPGRIGILLGADVFSHTVLNGWWSGPFGTRSVLETRFGWVLSGKTQPEYPQQQVVFHLSSVSTIQEYPHRAEHVHMRDVENNSRLRRCGNHLKASTMEIHNQQHVTSTFNLVKYHKYQPYCKTVRS